MKVAATSIFCLALGLWAGPIRAAEDATLNSAYQDHIAYVATFALPVLIEKCVALQPGYLQKAGPLYFRYINTHQDQIERGRLLTLAELAPDQTAKAYRESVIATRLSKLDSGTREEKLRMCEGALGMLSGNKLPGEWPPRPSNQAR